MRDTFACFQAEHALLLNDDQYRDFVMDSVRTAKRRIAAVMFIVSVTGSGNPTPVKELVDELAFACWRGLDVRLIIGTSTTDSIALANEISYRYAREMNVPVRYYQDQRGRSTHSKYVVIDDQLVIVGSHNWTTNALSANKEQSLAMCSPAAATVLSREFESSWKLASRCRGWE